MGSSEKGLCTEHAINILTREIETVLKQFKHSRKHKSWVKETLHHSSKHTTLNWIALCLLIWSAASLALSHVVGPQNYGNAYVCEAVIVVLLVVLSLVSELYDNYVRHYEITRRTEAVVEKLKNVASKVEWAEENYPSLLIPFTPCITLQWTYRDGNLVNLPWSLLVKDDIIMVRPGQQSPGYCESLDKTSENHLLHAREVFAPHLIEPDDKNLISHPKIRKPLKGCKYKLLETPYLNNLRIMLEQSLLRPVTHQNQQRHYLLVEIVQRIMLPIVLALFFGVSLYKHFYLGIGHPVRLFLLAPTEGLLPLLPIVFPLLWNLANYIGMAKFQAIFNETKNDAKKESVTLEEDTDHVTEEDDFLKYSKKKMFFNFLSILKGEPEIMARSSNILHVLGSVTALCCVDKKGVLSWPNPTAEKVFFLHNNEDLSSSSSLSNVGEIEHDNYSGTPLRKMPQSPGRGATVEVLDLTHNHHDPFKLHFDDHDWDKHISSLKPLGLAILLNTCNMDTQKQYMQFCSHITCESMQSENLVPVTNRRCLCELAKEIGFSEYAQKVFSLEQQLSTFRHLQPELARRDNKYARSLQLLNSRLKFPFPHMFAVVVREVGTGAMQLLSEGTADILLDSCVDYWDGKDLTPLTQSDRKKIQDFYQRTSLTAYCTAFAYRPLSRTTTPNVAECYLELPSDSKHLYLGRSPTPIHNWDRGILEPRTAPLSLFYSTDSLLHPIDFAPEENVGDADGCFNIQCNQVFIGMVSMQYQALTDMVHLIEQLERACIRFVHFSKENELRSRVFSEKMGLESGWNCHISLLSERTSNLENARAMSFSAPSAINMEQSVVRFDTIVTNKSCSDQSSLHEPEDSKENTPETQELINHASHDWQSLSCLTDSTDQSAPIHFDMSNRAKLPRGIDKIRPHIELIDNVPLLVSLFTDCTSCATREMLQIMQDYGEIVCIFGSAANNENVGIFMQADASIAVEPLYPQVCQKKSVFSPTTKCISPVELARDLNSLASSLSLKREDPTSFFHLIMVARHYVITLWSAVQFWVCCAGLITGVQLVCTLALLPPPLSTGQVLWLVCVVVPLLSASLLALPVDPEVMKIPLGKNHLKVNLKMLIFIIWCYGFKFLPTVLTILVSFGAILTAHCSTLCGSLNCTCLFFHTPLAENRDGLFKMDGWIEDTWSITISRHFMLLIIVLHLCFISMSFVHREHLLFQRSPHKNMTWLVTTVVLILLQSFYTVLNYHLIRSDFEDTENFVVPNWVIIFGSLSPIFAAIIIELVKYQEIGVNRRFQRRARLDFGTKLGMNSPF